MTPAQPPRADMAVPATVRRLAGGDAVRPVWENELGGLTFDVGAGAHRRFVKWAPPGSGLDLAAEATRLRWAFDFVAVPAVLDHGAGADGEWLVTSPLPGRSAVSERWCNDPATAVTAVGRGLRALHDRAPVATCPFDWSHASRVQHARARAAAGLLVPARWHAEHRTLGIERALARLDDPPPVDRLVVCHGDACAPNTIVANDGRCSGLVDLGALGVADRWADLAIATWSTEWNYGPGWQRPLLDAYGIDPDPERTHWYRLLWDLT